MVGLGLAAALRQDRPPSQQAQHKRVQARASEGPAAAGRVGAGAVSAGAAVDGLTSSAEENRSMHGRVGVGAAGVAAPGAAEGAGAGGVDSVAVSAPPRPSGCQSSRPPEGAAEGPFPAKTREDDTHEGPLDPQACNTPVTRP